jgi:rhodanese-related sulfurtransferase
MKRATSFLAVLALVGTSGILGAQAVRNVPRISIDELKVLMAKRQALLVDVRNAQEFADGHIPGAINIPYGQASAQEEALRTEKRTIVIYCACVNESSAARAAVELVGLGIPQPKALLGGWDEWLRRREPVEK